MSFEMVEGMLAEMNPSLLFDMQKYHPSAFRKFQDFKNSFLYKLIKNNLERGIKEELYRPGSKTLAGSPSIRIQNPILSGK